MDARLPQRGEEEGRHEREERDEDEKEKMMHEP